MKREALRAILAAVALLATSLPCSAQGRQQQAAPPSSPMVLVKGAVIVVVRDAQGRTLGLSSDVSITLSAPGGPVLPFTIQRNGEEWVFPNLDPGVQYTVKVEAPGYQTAEQYVDLPYSNAPTVRAEFYLLPTKTGPAAKPEGGAILAPRAQKEVQQGLKDLKANKIGSAQKHLAKALKMAPGNPLVNYLMGESWLRASKAEEAIPYLENAISLDPKQTGALMALGTVRYQQGDMPKAIDLLKRAVESNRGSWQAHWLLAAAFLRAGGYEMAREQAESALKYGKEQADPARLILGEALARLGKRDQALETFSDYLKRHPNDPRAKQIRGLMAKLQQPPEAATEAAHVAGKQPQEDVQAFADSKEAPAPRRPKPTPTADLSATPTLAAPTPPPTTLATVPAEENWAPPDVDAEKPEIISDATCRLPQILREAAKHAEELVSDLQKFSATEDFQDVEIKRNGGLSRPLTGKFSYLVFIHNLRPNLISIQEMRTPSPAALLGGDRLVSTGSAALALVFHPDFAKDFTWKCDGMGEWKGQPAWVIHFQQRADRPTSRLHGFETPAGGTLLALKGLAWVAANGDHVLHLETDLVKPAQELQFDKEHFVINYTLVRFRTHPVALWLPESVDAYFRYRDHSYHQYSRFTNFELFWVGTGQKIEEPKQKSPKQ
jgi:tetratricopeptide (TPR) repeat protein